MDNETKNDIRNMAAELRKIQECGDNVTAYIKGVIAGATLVVEGKQSA